jgi:hypothetical protein
MVQSDPACRVRCVPILRAVGLNVVRWRALLLGCVTALGMRVALATGARALGLPFDGIAEFVLEFAALLLAGYVAGHIAGSFEVLHGALAASAYIFVDATITSVREASIASQLGVVRLPPIDFVQLAVTDLIALIAASFGALISSTGRPSHDRTS